MTKRTKAFKFRTTIPKWEAEVHNFLAGQIKSSTSLVLLAMIRKIVQEEKNAWLKGERCLSCGKEMEPHATTNNCADCWEDG